MAASSSSTTHVTTKLRPDSSSDEYRSWSEVTLRLLQSRRLNGFIDGSLPLPPETNSQAHKDWKRIDRSVKEWIVGALSDAFLPAVVGRKTSRDVWLQLETIFTQPTAPSSPPPSRRGTLSITFLISSILYSFSCNIFGYRRVLLNISYTWYCCQPYYHKMGKIVCYSV